MWQGVAHKDGETATTVAISGSVAVISHTVVRGHTVKRERRTTTRESNTTVSRVLPQANRIIESIQRVNRIVSLLWSVLQSGLQFLGIRRLVPTITVVWYSSSYLATPFLAQIAVSVADAFGRPSWREG